MQKLSYIGLVSALRNSGIEQGDVVHVQSDLLRIGPVDCPPTREAMLDFYLAAFVEVLGKDGTLTVGTSFEDYARYGVPFVREESPSRQGVFSEFVRTRPRSVRSLHPIVSVTSLGAKAREICGPSHFEGFGYLSPWGRLHRLGAKIMALGLGSEHEGGTTFFHYLERLYGVPYQYTKVYTTPVYSEGKPVSGTFTMSVRYLDFGIVNDTLRFKQLLVRKGLASDIPVGRGRVMCVSCKDIIDVGMNCLDDDRYFLLASPPAFRNGEIPMDGVTGSMQAVYDRARTS